MEASEQDSKITSQMHTISEVTFPGSPCKNAGWTWEWGMNTPTMGCTRHTENLQTVEFHLSAVAHLTAGAHKLAHVLHNPNDVQLHLATKVDFLANGRHSNILGCGHKDCPLRSRVHKRLYNCQVLIRRPRGRVCRWGSREVGVVVEDEQPMSPLKVRAP